MMQAEGRRKKQSAGASCGPRFFVFLLSAFILLPSAFLRGQIKGDVESIGYENLYRPDCWTPMVVRLIPQTDKSADYLIRVHQEDLDSDRPIYTRQVTVTGNGEGQTTREQRFRIYFKPTPTDGGLPDANDTAAMARLQKKLSVELCTLGGKFVTQLPMTATVMNLDNMSNHRGSRLVLVVNGGRSAASRREYEQDVTLGMMEDVAMVPVGVRDLPESVLGYDAVDAVLWLDADPVELSSGGDEKLRALQNYVKRGGNLAVCQQTDQWQKTLQFGDMLPVTVQGVRNKSDAEPLKSIAAGGSATDPWPRVSGPMTLGIGVVRGGAFVDNWIDWNGKGTDLTPYIARRGFGCGGVTWVAQDLGDPSLTRIASSNWPVVWNQVFGWKDLPLVITPAVSQLQRDKWLQPRGTADAGKSLIGGMDLSSTSLWLIAVAVVFFIAYWVVAGPGAYIYLVAKSKASASWFVFAAAALVFTLLTLLLVDVILRGPPELKHFSLVRDTTGQPAYVYSRFGLYIKSNLEQAITLKDSAPGTVADLTAFAIHPRHLGDSAPTDIGPEYSIPVSDTASGDTATVRVPYRSTLKKLEAEWSGDHAAMGLSGGIEGSAKIVAANSYVDGKLTNGTGKKLKDVFLAFRWCDAPDISLGQNSKDMLLYIPEWKPGATLDLKKEYSTYTDAKGGVHAVPFLGATVAELGTQSASPLHGYKVRGWIQGQNEWGARWQEGVQGGFTSDTVDYETSLWMLSFFNRLEPEQTNRERGRIELLRRSARRFDASTALAAGSMVIIAQSEADAPNPLPMPLEVNGDPVKGTGATLYQFIVPMDNSFATTPATQPSRT